MTADRPKVLVKEKIAEAGVDLLREQFDVEVGTDWGEGELDARIGEFDAILIRSATKMTAELIGRATRLRAIGRAGTGVDNVDIEAATKRGIIVANAPESNSVAAATGSSRSAWMTRLAAAHAATGSSSTDGPSTGGLPTRPRKRLWLSTTWRTRSRAVQSPHGVGFPHASPGTSATVPAKAAASRR